MLNSLTAGFKLAPKTMFAINLNHFYFHVKDEAEMPEDIARQRLYKNFFIEGMVGRTFGRSYEQYAGDQTISFGLPLITFGDDRSTKNVTFNDGMIFTLKLIFNMKVPE